MKQGRAQTMDLGALRRHHMSLVLELLLREGPASRASLAAKTGLAKASVSSVVSDLDEAASPAPEQAGAPVDV